MITDIARKRFWAEPQISATLMRDHTTPPFWTECLTALGNKIHLRQIAEISWKGELCTALMTVAALRRFSYTNTFQWWTPFRKQQVQSQRHGPLARYVTLRVAHAPGMPGTFSPSSWVSDPDMHRGTCVAHVPRCIPGSLTSGCLWNRWRGMRSWHSRCMHTPQFYESGKRPME